MGYVSSNVRTSRNVPSSKGVSAAGVITGSGGSSSTSATARPADLHPDSRGPKMTAFHSRMLSGHGAPDTPLGGSLDSALKSRIRRRRAVPD